MFIPTTPDGNISFTLLPTHTPPLANHVIIPHQPPIPNTPASVPHHHIPTVAHQLTPLPHLLTTNILDAPIPLPPPLIYLGVW